jgi:hypothetical protein
MTRLKPGRNPVQRRIGTTKVSGGVSRRRFSGMLASFVGIPFLDLPGFGGTSIPDEFLFSPQTDGVDSYPLFDEAVSQVLPASGFQTRIALNDSIVKLVEHGVIDPGKFFALYGTSGPHPEEFASVLSKPSPQRIPLTNYNASYYVNLLWPVGLATHMRGNADSPINGDSLYGFASTGGWTLGREENGGAYFDKFPILDLTDEQAARVVAIAEATYRPCCNNSTFYQDCNHGSALLGLLQLGAAQGLGDDELYREGLAFNSFWFPDYYVRTALFFKVVEGKEWPDVDPRVVLGFDYSAGGPWQENVAARLEAYPDLIPPEPGGGAGCGV